MATNHRRFSGPSAHGQDGLDHALEKNHGPVLAESASIAASRPHPGESFNGGGYVMTCCGEMRCVCACPSCAEKSIGGYRCDACNDLNARKAG